MVANPYSQYSGAAATKWRTMNPRWLLMAARGMYPTFGRNISSSGVWLIEMMTGQAQTVVAKSGSYCNIEIHADLAGIERFALAYRV